MFDWEVYSKLMKAVNYFPEAVVQSVLLKKIFKSALVYLQEHLF